MKKSSAFTIVEMLTAMAVFTTIFGALTAIFVSGWQAFRQEAGFSETQGQSKLVSSIITREILQASRILTSRTFGSTAYTSSTNAVVFEIPSIDTNQNIIEGSFDYAVFYLDPTDTQKLKITREAAAGSSRLSETKVISTLVSNLIFTYKRGSDTTPPGCADAVVIEITSSQTAYSKTKGTKLTSRAKLRNKASSQGSTQLTLQPGSEGKDAFVTGGVDSGDDNYGTDASLWVGTGPSAGMGYKESYLQFDLSSIPSGSTINSATLKLYLYNPPILDTQEALYGVTGAWDEGTITWNNKPAYDVPPTTTKSLIVYEPSGWKSYSITSLVSAWVGGSRTNYGLVILQTDEGQPGKEHTYYSSDNSDNHPNLIIEYGCPES